MMMILWNKRTLLPVLVVMLAAGCGGSGGSSEDEFVREPADEIEVMPPADELPLFEMSEPVITNLDSVVVDATNGDVGIVSGTLDGDTQTISVGELLGAVTDNKIDLSGGGRADLDPQTNQFSAFVSAQPTGFSPFFGVIGVPADPGNLSGTASYSGISKVSINDGSALYDLEGTVVVSTDFVVGDATVTLSNLSGERRAGLAAPTDVSNLLDIKMTDVQINEAQLTAGNVTITSTSLPSLSSDADFSHAGSLFGTDGEEVGGGFIIDDVATSSIEVTGRYLGQ